MILPKEKQCVSLGTAKRMKGLGFEMETQWYWVRGQGVGYYYLVRKDEYEDKEYVNKTEHYAAFTTSELGVILPKKLKDGTIWASFPCENEKMWCVNYSHQAKIGFHDVEAEWEAESRGLMACYLREKGLLPEQPKK